MKGRAVIGEADETIFRHYLATGSEDDLRELLVRYREGLTLFAYEIVHNLEDAEEIMLDSLAVVASGTARFDGRSSFRTWLFAIARRQAASRLRRRHIQEVPFEDCMDETTSPVDARLMREERHQRLFQALDQLSPDYREALYLLYFEEMSNEEVARVMHKSPKQIYNLVHRGRQALKDVCTRMGMTDADL